MLPHEHHPQEKIAKFGYKSYRNCFFKKKFFLANLLEPCNGVFGKPTMQFAISLLHLGEGEGLSLNKNNELVNILAHKVLD
jgi:hypothetical protein